MPKKADAVSAGAVAMEAAAPPAQAAPPAPKRTKDVVPATSGNKPLRSPDEWGMLAVKVKTIIEEEELPNGRTIRKSRLECKELDNAVLVTKNCDYVTYDSNGVEHYHQVDPKTVFVPKKEVDSAIAKGYTVVEDAPNWRHFKLKAE